MSKKNDFPVTPAVRLLKDKKIEFESYLYDYEEKGGTQHTAIELKVDEHTIIKTLVFSGDDSIQFIILMHGDREVSVKELARQIGVKTALPSDAKTANKFTGYEFGGTSPFGTKREMTIYAEATIFSLEKIYINGGKRGYIISLNPNDIKNVFKVKEVNVAIEK